MNARRTPRGPGATERAESWTRCIDALHQHCEKARSIAALLALCGEVDSGDIDVAAVGSAARWMVEELEALRGCVRGLEEAK